MYLTNAFGLNMLGNLDVNISVLPLTVGEVRAMGNLESAVGHPDTTRVFSGMLGFKVACNRVSLSLQPGDRVVVGQYRGPRLEAGATTLPEGARIAWVAVEIFNGLGA